MSHPLNISYPAKDSRHEEVLKQIDDQNEILIDSITGPGNSSLQTVIVEKAPQNKRVHFDLIAHAADGVLCLADWSVEGDKVAAALFDAWSKRSPKGVKLGDIRLLGCNTAGTTRGIKALRSLSAKWGVAIKGTTTPIDGSDFSGDGFVSENVTKVVPSTATRLDIQEDTDALRLGWFTTRGKASMSLDSALNSLSAETLSDVQRERKNFVRAHRWKLASIGRAEARTIFRAALDTPRRSPGLLALPDVEFLWPAFASSGLPRFHRATILLGGGYARIYPAAQPDGVVVCLSTTIGRRLRELARDAPIAGS